jgi:hypothetical protein
MSDEKKDLRLTDDEKATICKTLNEELDGLIGKGKEPGMPWFLKALHAWQSCATSKYMLATIKAYGLKKPAGKNKADYADILTCKSIPLSCSAYPIDTLDDHQQPKKQPKKVADPKGGKNKGRDDGKDGKGKKRTGSKKKGKEQDEQQEKEKGRKSKKRKLVVVTNKQKKKAATQAEEDAWRLAKHAKEDDQDDDSSEEDDSPDSNSGDDSDKKSGKSATVVVTDSEDSGEDDDKDDPGSNSDDSSPDEKEDKQRQKGARQGKQQGTTEKSKRQSWRRQFGELGWKESVSKDLYKLASRARYIDLKLIREVDAFEEERKIVIGEGFTMSTGKRAKEVTTISEWMLLFERVRAMYAVFFAGVMDPKLARYQLWIMSTSLDGVHTASAILKYDVRVRRKHTGPKVGFAKIDLQLATRFLFAATTAGQAVVPGSRPAKSVAKQRLQKPCYPWLNGTVCNRKPCLFRHSCLACPGVVKHDPAACKHKKGP